jgi:hydrogenase/urease accessory protein HupE
MTRVLVALAFALSSAPEYVSAHALAPSVLTFELGEGGRVTMRWRAPVQRPTGQSLTPQIPTGCQALGEPVVQLDEDGTAATRTLELDCESTDLVGSRISVDGFEDSQINVVVRIVRSDGEAAHTILDAGRPSLVVAPAEQRIHSFVEYLLLGIEHLLTGWDHLTFVLGLLILFGWHRRLVAAVTAFTIGHSLTLALSVLGLLSVPQAPVEALIAVTIVVLALEIQVGGRGPVWRHPWTLPGALGLLHGLGFASVLFEAGLPRDEIPLALLGFNLGLEIGQLGVIVVLAALGRVLRPILPSALRDNRAIPAYAIGSLAAFWVIERTVAILAVA